MALGRKWKFGLTFPENSQLLKIQYISQTT